MSRWVSSALRSLKFFLPECVHCSHPSADFLCELCVKALSFHDACGICGANPLAPELELTCLSCQSRAEPWDSLSLSFFYQGGLREWLCKAKDHEQPEKFQELKASHFRWNASVRSQVAGSFVVSVSGDPSRSRERGYDPAEVLAERLTQVCGGRLLKKFFVRKSFLETQKDLDAATRQKFLKTLVAVSRPFQELKGPSVILVDDVMTTGASLRVHAELLKKQFEKVHVFCLSRTLKHH